ncbi:phosphoribosylglycinamide formyltransferase [Ascidiimonas sp. W6]|uniref:phosphoribosylglycinamide formyltransferase n=1 Tax=Ascidiimonas meishanensis TaxID=3128903 RepID=UPI0030EB57A4
MRIVIFASGNGSNAENIINYFSDNQNVTVSAVFSNKNDAMVLARANRLKIPTIAFNKKALEDSDCILGILKSINPDLIVLAGFLWKFPAHIIKVFPDKIINIHPALLPKYGGKGMYGMHVHNAIVKNKEQETGITIHYVNEHYDEGAIIFQKTVNIDPSDSPDDVARKVHSLEYTYFPQIIEKILHGEV